MISRDTIDKLRELPIYDVVSRYSDITLKKSGASYHGLSPWTSEKSPSFFVHPGKNIFKDHSSGKGGNNAISFVMLKEGLSFIDACKSLAEQHSIPIEYTGRAMNEKETEDQAKKIEIRSALEWACAHFCSNPVPESFTVNRAFPETIIEAFRVGYAKASWDDLLKSATAAGIGTDTLVQAGLIRKREGKEGHYDTFRDRVILPVVNYRGNVIGFTGRDAATSPAEKDKTVPKYQHTEGMDKSKHLFGLYQAIKGGKLKDGAYLVEGPTDVIRWHSCGITNTVGMQGSDFSEEQAKLLKRYTDKLTIVPDNDCNKEKNAGIVALHRNAPVAIKAGFTVKVLIPGK